jgi:hypothetical protein
MDINPDFRTRLRERSNAESERFELLLAGAYWMSIQPDSWFMRLSSTRALEDCDRWKVAIHASDGTTATPRTDPRIFRDGLWGQYWIESQQAPSVPTEVVQTLYDFLVLGAERYEEMTSKL